MNVKEIWHKIKAIPVIGKTYEKYIGSKKWHILKTSVVKN